MEKDMSQLGWLQAENARLQEQMTRAAAKAEADHKALKRLSQLESDLADERKYRDRMIRYLRMCCVPNVKNYVQSLPVGLQI